MKLIVTLRHPALGESARDHARGRLERLEQYFERITSAEAILSVEAETKRAEFVVHATRGAVLVAHGEDRDIRAAIDRAHNEMKRAITRHKERLIGRHRNGNGRRSPELDGETPRPAPDDGDETYEDVVRRA